MTYGVLIITTTKSSSWLNSNTSVSILYGIIRPSQNDKNMPRVSGRATVRLVRHFGIIFIPGFSLHGHKGLWTQSSVRSHAQKRKGSSWCLFFCFCLGLVFVFVFYYYYYLSFTSQQSGQWLSMREGEQMVWWEKRDRKATEKQTPLLARFTTYICESF